MQAGDASGGGGNATQHLTTEGRSFEHATGERPSLRIIRNTQRQRMLLTHPGRPTPGAVPYRPDAPLLPGADVDHAEVAPGIARHILPRGTAIEQGPTLRRLTAPQISDLPAPASGEAETGLTDDSMPREVEVHALEAERAGRVFPCFQNGHYTGCIGYTQCNVRCWAPRPHEREAVVRVEQPAGSPCRGCIYARPVPGDYAVLDGREVSLMECRLGFWYGRAALEDFIEDKIALNVTLPCPGFVSSDGSLPANGEDSEEDDDWLDEEEEDDWTV